MRNAVWQAFTDVSETNFYGTSAQVHQATLKHIAEESILNL